MDTYKYMSIISFYMENYRVSSQKKTLKVKSALKFKLHHYLLPTDETKAPSNHEIFRTLCPRLSGSLLAESRTLSTKSWISLALPIICSWKPCKVKLQSKLDHKTYRSLPTFIITGIVFGQRITHVNFNQFC